MKLYLLPRSFKWVGVLIPLLTIFVFFLLKLFIKPEFLKTVWVENLFRSSFLLGLLFLILSREKKEDEFINFCRFAGLCICLSGWNYFIYYKHCFPV